MKARLCLVILLSMFAALCMADTRCVIRIDDPGTEEVFRLINDGWDIACRVPGEYLDLVVSESAIPDLCQRYPELSVTQTEAQLKAALISGRDIPGYHNYAEVLAQIMQAQAQYPNLVQVIDIGDSWGSIYTAQNIPAYQNFEHQLWAVKVSNNVSITEDEPAFYFVGAHHAREPISTEVCLEILANLTDNYGVDPIITALMNSAEIWIVPLINPDGHKVVLDQTDVWWRKNIRDNDMDQEFSVTGSSNDGVDINRNYAYKWGYMSSSDLMNTPTYHGSGPLSEPESSAFATLISSRRFLAGISYHTYGQYVMYPYGYVYDIQAPDRDEMASLAFQVADMITNTGSVDPYTAMPSYTLYPVSGSLDDWVYSSTGAFSYTVEMAHQFIPPAASMPGIITRNVAGAMKLLDRKNSKMLRGHVTDAITGAPLRAMVHVDGIDDSPIYRTPIFADSLFGSYYRLLPAGENTVRFIMPGYQSAQAIVQIDPTSVTTLDVSLQPSLPYTLEVIVEDELHQPVSGADISFESTSLQTTTTDDTGSAVFPEFYPGQYMIKVSKPGYGTLRITRNVASPSITLRIVDIPTWMDGFESGNSNWTATPNWASTSSETYSGSMSLTDSPSGNYSDNETSHCRLTQPIDLSNVESASLQFWVKHDLALDGDYLSLQYSLDGQNWLLLWSVSETADWTLYDIDLNSFIGQSIYIRFLLFTDGYYVSDGVYIDDVCLFTGTQVSPVEDSVIPVPAITLAVSPNPFNGLCTARLTAKTPSFQPLTLGIHNLRGQLVREYRNISLTPQGTSVNWNGRDGKGSAVASGIYLFRLSDSGKTLATARALLLQQE